MPKRKAGVAAAATPARFFKAGVIKQVFFQEKTIGIWNALIILGKVQKLIGRILQEQLVM